MKDLADDVYKQLNAKEHNETAEYILLYGKFETAKDKLGPIINIIFTTPRFAFGQLGDTKDHSSYGPQYHHMFTTVCESYVKAREPIAPLILKRLRTFAPGSSALEDSQFKAFVRRCIQWVFDMCRNEINLVEKYFKNGPLMMEYSTELPDWSVPTKYLQKIEQTCMSHVATLYAFLTPYLNKCDLHRVCDLVSWLETTYLNTMDDEVVVEEDGHVLAAQTLLSNHMWPLLDQKFIKAAADFEYFRPSAEDLQIKIRKSRPVQARTVSRTASFSDDRSMISQSTTIGAGISRAYPTVKKAVDLLILYNDSVFDRAVSLLIPIVLFALIDCSM